MSNSSDAMLRSVLGPNLQVAALRAILLLAAFAFVGACCSWLLH